LCLNIVGIIDHRDDWGSKHRGMMFGGGYIPSKQLF
jgi:hypothetical protein